MEWRFNFGEEGSRAFRDHPIGGTDWFRWHHFSTKTTKGRGLRAGEPVSYDHATEWGRRPYVDGSNWGVPGETHAYRQNAVRRKGRIKKQACFEGAGIF
jgi:hypothetical protein